MRFPASFRDASIRHKLMFIAFLATVVATLFAMLVLTVQQGFLLRNELVKNVYAQASIVATNSTSALVFNDREAAEQTLGALAPIDNIELVRLLDKTGKEFALYVRPGLAMRPHQHTAADEDDHFHSMTHIEIVIPIIFKQERIGSIHVRSSMMPVYKALAWSVLMIAVAATVALLVAVMLVLRLLPAITDPLQYLVGLMSTVSRDKNYTLRAESHSKDEVGILAGTFNDMLERIQERDAELEQHRERLEEEVVQRTAALREANLLLEKELLDRNRAEEEIRRLNEELEEKVEERTQQLLEAQEELVRKEKLAVLGQVAGSVGHELRNPLGVMSNAVYFLQTVLSDADETTREYLNIIKDEIAGSERIVSDLLDAVRTKPPHQEAVGLREVIGQTLGKLTIPPSVSVKLDIPETLPALRVDAMQIHQVFRNLISNGVEAMPEGGTLEIQANEDTQASTVTVSVRDSGTGIAPEILPKLFQPLFTTKARGIGLGLVVVKNLTQANGGSVNVQSEPGKGTTFTITLPSAG